MKRTRNVLLNLAGSAVMALSLGGCPDEEEQPSGGETDGIPAVCALCTNAGSLPAKCVCTGENPDDEQFLCWGDQVACDDHCEGQLDPAGAPLDREDYIVLPCKSASVSGSCKDWRPSGEIDLVAGVYEIDQNFAENLTFDSSAPLWSCDDARIVSKPGGFEIADADAGEFLYEVGLRNFDKVLTINGQDVTTWAGAETVFNSFLAGTSTFSVTVARGGGTVSLTWTLVS